MRNKWFVLVACAVATIGGSLGARGVAEDKAVEVLAASRKAIGDKQLDALRTFSLEATVQRHVGNMQMTTDTEILLALPDKYLRSDSSSGGMMSMSSATGFNGGTAIRPAGATMAPGGGMVIRMGPGGPIQPQDKLTPEQEAEMNRMMLRSSRHDISRLMLGWFASVHPAVAVEYTYAGEAESPDGKAHVIDAKNADGFTARLFIDQQTSLPLMLTYQGPQPRVMTSRTPRPGGTGIQNSGGQAGHARELTEEERKKADEDAERQIREMQAQPPALVEHTLFFDDWRSTDGVRFPHTIRRAVAGTTSEEWAIRKVRINPKIDAGQFER
jgi:hypothetical protein